mgnify:CR=1 FL=1
MKTATIQMNLTWEDRPANHARARTLSEQAASSGATLIVLPEMFATGFSMNPSATAEPLDGPTPTFLRTLASDLNVTIIGGYVDLAADGRGANTALAVGPEGNILAKYVKTHLIAYLGEDKAHVQGDHPASFTTGGTKIACFICYDLRFPELFRLVADDHHLICVIASWPSTRQRHWDVLLQARAIENQLYVMGVNRVGSGGGLDFLGGSTIIDPMGNPLAHGGDQEGIVMADIDPAEVQRVRSDLPFLRDRRF